MDADNNKTPAKFQSLYIIVFSLLFIIISGAFLTLIIFQNYQYFQYDNKVLEAGFKEYVGNIGQNFNKVHSRIKELRTSAEFDLYESRLSGPQMPFSFRFLKEFPKQGSPKYAMDEIDEQYKDFVVINLTGDGKIKNDDKDFLRTVQMCLNLMDDFHGFKQSVPEIIYTYFIGKDRLAVLYPWLPSSNFSFTPDIFEYDAWKLILPENNAAKTTIWTDVYFDDTGEDKGLMTSCVTPIYDDKSFIGMIGADIMVDYLNGVVSKFEPERSGEMIIYDRNRHVIAHPSKLSVNDKGMLDLKNILPEKLQPECSSILSLPPFRIQEIQGWKVLRGKIENTPFETIYLAPRQSMLKQIIGKLGLSVVSFFLIIQVLAIFVLFFTHKKFIHPAEKLVNFILARSQGEKPETLPKVPRMWGSWFAAVDTVFNDNMDLNQNLERQNIELVKNNKELMANIEKRIQTEKENQELEQQLHLSEKMRALGQLAGGVAHDFNNQLSIILSSGSTLSMKFPMDHKLQKYYDRIMTATRRSVDLVSQLLAFSRHGPIQCRFDQSKFADRGSPRPALPQFP